MASYEFRYVGADSLPSRLSAFDVQQYFRLSKLDVVALNERFRTDGRPGAAVLLLFMRASGRPMDRFTTLPKALLQHVGEALNIRAPAIASLRSIYARRQTLYEHQLWLKGYLGHKDVDQAAVRFPKKLLLLCWMILVLVSPEVHAQRVKPAYESNFKLVRAMLGQPESQMDLASIKLTVDKMIDPATDKAAVLKQLDDMASEIRASFPLGASNLVKFKALRDYLYQPPLLSGRRPFMYNLEDDRNPKAKLLSVYLATRKGNCISMPLLFVNLGQKLGIPVAITTAPAHLYVKFRGDNGSWYGVETTNGGGWADDDWQKKQFPRLTEKAIANGIYLKPLTKKETAVVIADSLLEHYENQRSVEANRARVKLALLQIDHYPKNVVAMVHVYLGYRELQQKLFVEKYPQPSDIPHDLWPQFEQIEKDSMYWGNKAKELGYLGSTPEMDAAYRERIRRALAGK